MTRDQIPNRQLGLERLCKTSAPTQDHIAVFPPCHGLERFEAFFHGHPYAPHRHDTYGLGITTRGVQSFGYRGETRHSLAGQIYVLHPDELHDGWAGTSDGFGYRILHLDPSLVHQALNGRALPFVSRPVTDNPRLRRALNAFLGHMSEPIDELAGTGRVVALADALETISNGGRKPAPVDPVAVEIARDLLDSYACRTVTSQDLEDATGQDRWSLARQFRAAFGVSPHRFQTSRRLDRARALIAEGTSLAEAAHQTGFADQSHLSRHFRSAFGVPPGVWRTLTETSNGAPVV